MTQPSRTTETINRDNAAIRGIMHQVRELTVPDRATLALGLVGHLATMMNRSQMSKLMDQLRDEVVRVQDVPPGRQRDDAAPADGSDSALDADADTRSAMASAAGFPKASATEPATEPAMASGSRPDARSGGRSRSSASTSDVGQRTSEIRARGRAGAGDADIQLADPERTSPTGDVLRDQVTETMHPHEGGVGQAGRGEFRSRKLL